MLHLDNQTHSHKLRAAWRGVLALALLPALLAGVACASNSKAAARSFAESGARFMKQEKFSDAAIQFRNALQQEPTNWRVRYQLSQAEGRMDNWQASFRALNAIVAAQPSFAPARLDLAAIDLMGGQTHMAEHQIDQVLSANLGNLRAEILQVKVELAAKKFHAARIQCGVLRAHDPKDATIDGMCGLADLGLHDLAAAESAFRLALTLQPGSASETRDLANVLELEKRPKQAETLLVQSAHRYPNSLNLQLVLADFYVRHGQMSKADTLLSGLFEHKPPFAELAATLGDFWMNHNELTRAVADYRIAEKAHPNPRVERNLASAYLTLQRIPAASRYTQMILRNNPHSSDGHALKGALDYLQGDYAQASETLQRAIKDDPESLLAKYYLGMTYLATGQLDRAQGDFNDCIAMNSRFLQAYVKLGQIALEEGDWRLGAAYAERVNQVNPSSFDAYLLLAQADMMHNDLAQAGRLIAAAEKIPSAPPQIHEVAARYDILKNNFAAADKELDLAAATSPNPFALVRWYDLQLAAAGQYERAIAILRKEMSGSGPNAEASVLLAELDLRAGKMGQAGNSASQALAEDPQLSSAHDVLGEVFERDHQPAQAATQFAKAVQLAPKRLTAYLLAGRLFLQEAEYPRAHGIYEAGLAQFPNSDPLKLGLARTLAAQGSNLDRALTIAQDLKSRHPDNAQVADTLGWIYHAKGFQTLALPQLKQASRALPTDANVQFHLGMTLMANGRKEQGRAALTRAIQLGLAAPDKSIAKRALGAKPAAQEGTL